MNPCRDTHLPEGLPEGVTPLRAGDPRRIADHSLLGRPGSAGMATVYAAANPDRGCVAPTLAHEAAPAAIDRDADIMGPAHAAYAVGGHATGPFPARPSAAIDHPPGHTLRRRLRQEGTWRGEATLVLLAGCAEALA